VKCEAKLVLEAADAQALADSLKIDDVSAGGLSVETKAAQGSVTSIIKAESPRTILSTVDDVLRCAAGAKEVVQ